MFQNHPNLATLLLATLCLGLVETASAQTDRLYPNDGDVVLGKISSVSKNGIVITAKGKDQQFAAGTIRKVLFQGDPPGLTKGRESALDNQFEQALEELKTVDMADLTRPEMKADAQFYIVLSQGNLALSGKGDLASASTAAMGFASKNGDSWHFFEIAKLLGDLAAAIGNHEQALRFYGSLRSAPSMEMKIESVYQTGMVKLAQGDLPGAKTELEKVAGLNAKSAEQLRLKTLAKAGVAVVTAKQGQGDAALTMVKELIAQLNPTDTETAAKIYNAQGASYEAMGDDEGAILAYLHTQLMFSTHSDSHVESLKRLAELWNKVGKPDRAAAVRGELHQRYPGLSG